MLLSYFRHAEEAFWNVRRGEAKRRNQMNRFSCGQLLPWCCGQLSAISWESDDISRDSWLWRHAITWQSHVLFINYIVLYGEASFRGFYQWMGSSGVTDNDDKPRTNRRTVSLLSLFLPVFIPRLLSLFCSSVYFPPFLSRCSVLSFAYLFDYIIFEPW